jgi:hypothetical protein
MAMLILSPAGDQSQQTLSLSQRLLEYEPEHEARLDGDCRVDRLTAPLSGGRRLPCRDRLLDQYTLLGFHA